MAVVYEEVGRAAGPARQDGDGVTTGVVAPSFRYSYRSANSSCFVRLSTDSLNIRAISTGRAFGY
jgi:hypothetical protein